jgi:predicted esterase
MDVPLLVLRLSCRFVAPALVLIVAATLVSGAHAQEPAPADAPAARPAVDLKKLANKLAYAFEPSVFSSAEFPPGAVLGDEKVRAALGDVQAVTTFYNEKFEEVKRADAPGRYGAVVRITLPDGTPLTRFVTLYRLPEGAATQLVKLGGKAKVPVETGTGPEVAQRQFEEVAIGLKGAMGGELLGGPRLANLVMALPGVPPDQLLSSFLSFMARDDAWWYELRKRIGLGETYRYQTQLPEGYAADAAKRWPLILYLHGSGDRGDNLAILNHNGLPKRVAGGQKLPAIVVSPQCPGGWWSTPVLSQLIDEVSAKYQVDPDRIIVTGLSMGGFGTWAMAEAYPDRFSAIAPICGGGNPAEATRLRNLPVWAFHGQQDTTVPVQLSETMVASIRSAGGAPHLTIYLDARHDSWTKAYATDALYTWMLAQQRGKPEVKTEGLPTN